jgi:hypothetical protein
MELTIATIYFNNMPLYYICDYETLSDRFAKDGQIWTTYNVYAEKLCTEFNGFQYNRYESVVFEKLSDAIRALEAVDKFLVMRALVKSFAS